MRVTGVTYSDTNVSHEFTLGWLKRELAIGSGSPELYRAEDQVIGKQEPLPINEAIALASKWLGEPVEARDRMPAGYGTATPDVIVVSARLEDGTYVMVVKDPSRLDRYTVAHEVAHLERIGRTDKHDAAWLQRYTGIVAKFDKPAAEKLRSDLREYIAASADQPRDENGRWTSDGGGSGSGSGEVNASNRWTAAGGASEVVNITKATPRNQLIKEINAQPGASQALVGVVEDSHKGNRIALARDGDGKIVGAIAYNIDRYGCVVHDVRTDTASKGSGIGTELFGRVASEARDRGVELQIRGSLSTAESYYAKIGGVNVPWSPSTFHFTDETRDALADGHPVDQTAYFQKWIEPYEHHDSTPQAIVDAIQNGEPGHPDESWLSVYGRDGTMPSPTGGTEAPNVIDAETASAAEFYSEDQPRAANGRFGSGESMHGTPAEQRASRRLANAKIRNAPVPSREDVVKARHDLATSKRPGGNSRGGGSKARERQRQNLFNEFGGEKRGYVVCPWTGVKMHWADPKDRENNPNGYEKLSRGKIWTKWAGGSYTLGNLLPESLAANQARGDKPLRKENLD